MSPPVCRIRWYKNLHCCLLWSLLGTWPASKTMSYSFLQNTLQNWVFLIDVTLSSINFLDFLAVSILLRHVRQRLEAVNWHLAIRNAISGTWCRQILMFFLCRLQGWCFLLFDSFQSHAAVTSYSLLSAGTFLVWRSIVIIWLTVYETSLQLCRFM